jgi:hypothetical protein
MIKTQNQKTSSTQSKQFQGASIIRPSTKAEPIRLNLNIQLATIDPTIAITMPLIRRDLLKVGNVFLSGPKLFNRHHFLALQTTVSRETKTQNAA